MEHQVARGRSEAEDPVRGQAELDALDAPGEPEAEGEGSAGVRGASLLARGGHQEECGGRIGVPRCAAREGRDGAIDSEARAAVREGRDGGAEEGEGIIGRRDPDGHRGAEGREGADVAGAGGEGKGV